MVLSTPAAASLEVNVTRVGFPGLGGDLTRNGTWTPIAVDVDLIGEPSFNGYLRVGQYDTDGDECYDRHDLHLRQETGGHQRVFLYPLANLNRSQGRYYVEVFDSEGRAVQVVCQGKLTYQAEPAGPPWPTAIDHDSILILSISSGALGRVQDLVGKDQQNLYRRPPYIAHMNPADLPELWVGLEAVDIIIWDDARPEDLTERQRAALAEWVKQGGHLLMAASRSASSIKLTDSMNAILPVDLGDVVSVDNLPDVRRALLGPSRSEKPKRRRRNELQWWQQPFVETIPMVETTLRADSYRFPARAGYTSDVITRRNVGRGLVTFCAVTLKDLFSGEGSAIGFFQTLFDLRVLDENEQITGGPMALFPQVANAVAFIRSGSAYLLVAGIFSLLYVLAATFGSWHVLSVKGWRQHSWSLFAVIGAAASVLSVFAVNAMRGFGEALHQISVVDMRAGDGFGYATALFGVKAGTDRRLDFWLPADPLGATAPTATNCFLRPLPTGNDPNETLASFADPSAYRLRPGSAVVENVRIRGTLKRFEGRWSGAVGGMLSAQVSIKGSEILEGSYLQNRLGFDLKECYLLHTMLNPEVAAGFRNRAIYALHLGEIPSDGQKLDLHARCYGQRGEESVRKYVSRWWLQRAQEAWSTDFRSALSRGGLGWGSDSMRVHGQEKNALLLLTTIGEYEPAQASRMQRLFAGESGWSRDRARALDLTEHLRRDTLLLLGFSDNAGPVRLFRRAGDHDYAVLKPDPRRSWTMFRIEIPANIVSIKEAEEEEEEPVR